MGTYPSIAGTYNGTIMPYHPLMVQTLYTYSCEGTGGHTEHVAFYYPNGTLLAEASWTGYENDWHNLSFSAPVTLEANVRYNYTIKTGSYPRQALHFTKLRGCPTIVFGTEIFASFWILSTIHLSFLPNFELLDSLLSLPEGEITCTSFTDVNGRVYYDWIPAIKLML